MTAHDRDPLSIDWGRVRGVVFDLVGTLVRPLPAAAEAYRAAGARFGQRLSAQVAAERFRQAFAHQEALDRELHGLRTSPERERDRWQAIVADVFPLANPVEPLFEHLWAHFARAENWQVFLDVPAALATVRRLELRLAIGSNFDERLHCVVQNCAGLGDFTGGAVFDSAALGWRKPAQPFFQSIEARLDLPPDALLMVGDDAQNDRAGAQAAGWQALLVGPERTEGAASGLGRMADCLAAALA